jgi:hypothetical protein
MLREFRGHLGNFLFCWRNFLIIIPSFRTWWAHTRRENSRDYASFPLQNCRRSYAILPWDRSCTLFLLPLLLWVWIWKSTNTAANGSYLKNMLFIFRLARIRAWTHAEVRVKIGSWSSILMISFDVWTTCLKWERTDWTNITQQNMISHWFHCKSTCLCLFLWIIWKFRS